MKPNLYQDGPGHVIVATVTQGDEILTAAQYQAWVNDEIGRCKFLAEQNAALRSQLDEAVALLQTYYRDDASRGMKDIHFKATGRFLSRLSGDAR